MKEGTMSKQAQCDAPEAAVFCDLLASARRHKLPGYWEGSAYCHHPCGVVRRGIIYTNEWNTNNYCSAEVMLDPTSPLAPRCRNPRAYGDPSCRPERGGTLRVYSDGNWSKDDGPWRAEILRTLEDLRREIAEAEAREAAEQEAGRQVAADVHAKRVAAARAALSKSGETVTA